MERDERTMAAEERSLLECAALIAWKPEYNLGIPIIDTQHQGLVAAINSLHFAITNKLGECMLEPTIEMVKAYIRTHFMTEELIFTRCGFPDAERHTGLHNDLANMMLDVGQESMFVHDPDHFLQFLKNWLIQHILGEDRKYQDYFTRHNTPRSR